MKIAKKKRKVGVLFLMTASFALSQTGFASGFTEKDILGVWELSRFFVTTEGEGSGQDWCSGAHGSIAYLPGLMSVSINCESTEPGSGAEKIGGFLFYSGSFEVDTRRGEVIHRLRNKSHPSFSDVYRRSIEMDDENHLRLIGSLGKGKKVIVEWNRQETFRYDSDPIVGVWELVGSENEWQGRSNVPFCTGFHGTILYTPGKYVAVSINCGEKENEEVEEPADQFGRRFFYAGTYQIDGETLIQTPANSSEEGLIGEPGPRGMSLSEDGETLVLRGKNGSQFRAEWKKLKSFVGIGGSDVEMDAHFSVE